MRKNKSECAFHGAPTVSDEFRKDLFRVRPLENAEKGKALPLAWRVFCEFESPDYALEGTEEFKKCLNDDAYLAGIRYYGAFDKDKLVGVLGIREDKFPGNHTILTVSESPVFNTPEAAIVTKPRLALVKQAGKQYAETGRIDAALLDEICSPMIPEEQYAAIVNGGV